MSQPPIPPIEAAAASVAAGVSAITVAALGVEPQPMAWVAFGAAMGIVTTKPAGRTRTVVVFVATVASGALLATVAARYYGLDGHWRNLLAWGLGAFFPVIKERLGLYVPRALDKLLARIKL